MINSDNPFELTQYAQKKGSDCGQYWYKIFETYHDLSEALKSTVRDLLWCKRNVVENTSEATMLLLSW